ncbi:cation diffusion facilitator family transporter [Aquamicrobium terrae]
MTAIADQKAASKRRVATLAIWSIVVAFVVTALKLLAWRMTGSVALYSDALESIANVVTAMAAYWAILVSHTPADEDHPFGHHKAEYFSAVLEGVLIVVAALLILAQVWQSLRNPLPLEEPWPGLAVNTGAAFINAAWAWVLIRNGRAQKSPALVADGQHIMTDVVTSFGVLAGLVAAVLTGWHLLDPLLALLVAINILYQGWRVTSESLSGLMDRAVDVQENMRIRDIISANSKGALEVHDLKTRIAGRATFIEFHLVVDAGMSVGESHVICDRIEDALKAEIPSVRITIHVEPDDEAKLPRGTAAVPFA